MIRKTFLVLALLSSSMMFGETWNDSDKDKARHAIESVKEDFMAKNGSLLRNLQENIHKVDDDGSRKGFMLSVLDGFVTWGALTAVMGGQVCAMAVGEDGPMSPRGPSGISSEVGIALMAPVGLLVTGPIGAVAMGGRHLYKKAQKVYLKHKISDALGDVAYVAQKYIQKSIHRIQKSLGLELASTAQELYFTILDENLSKRLQQQPSLAVDASLYPATASLLYSKQPQDLLRREAVVARLVSLLARNKSKLPDMVSNVRKQAQQYDVPLWTMAQVAFVANFGM